MLLSVDFYSEEGETPADSSPEECRWAQEEEEFVARYFLLAKRREVFVGGP